MARQSPSFGQTFLAALLGGVLGALLFLAPGVRILNLCCCLPVLLCGLLSGYFLTRKTKNGLTSGEGLTVGVLTGLIAGLGFSLVIAALWMSGLGERILRDSMQQNPMLNESQRQQFEQILPAMAGPLGALIMAFVFTIPSAIAGLLGGLIASAIWKPQPPLDYYQPPAPPQVPPPPPPPPPAAPTA